MNLQTKNKKTKNPHETHFRVNSFPSTNFTLEALQPSVSQFYMPTRIHIRAEIYRAKVPQLTDFTKNLPQYSSSQKNGPPLKCSLSLSSTLLGCNTQILLESFSSR